ncbi:hypothetical protein [Parenemella sanctibonifatiensis]|uniref:DUF3352 domain-containing protein n=1 Tax=Parenemella sanctibonifatiensis TaxID=2016505 RepID=A0A255ES22_9ACTN|nr:hypothetical protein [Parenemella sanctibonifatiensis]OYN90923.1 hypothetical protein CGZ91_05425 [Parenemella sanctibonifatiensis]
MSQYPNGSPGPNGPQGGQWQQPQPNGPEFNPGQQAPWQNQQGGQPGGWGQSSGGQQFGDQQQFGQQGQQQFGGQQFGSQQQGQPSGSQQQYAQGGPGMGAAATATKKGIQGKIGAMVAGVVALAVLVTGSVFAVNALTGAKDQAAAKALPAQTVLYLNIDLDPAMDQQTQLRDFVAKFPQLQEYESEADNYKQAIVESLLRSSQQAPEQWSDFEPWLGDSISFALIDNGGEEPLIAFVFASKDDDKAKELAPTAFNRIIGEGEFGLTVKDGFVILAENQANADAVVSGAENSTLDDNDAFTGDLDAVGDTGLGVVWVDTPKLQGMLPEYSEVSVAPRMAAAVRFDDSVLEIAGVYRDFPDEVPDIEGLDSLVTSLPEGTVMAGAVSNPDKQIQQALESLEATPEGADILEGIQEAASQYGLTFPDDLYALLGSEVVFAADGSVDDNQMPTFGMVSRTDPAAAQEVIGKLPPELELASASGDETFAVASNQAYAEQLAAGDGKLGDSDQFKQAVPDAKGATSVIYFDADRAVELLNTTGTSDEETESVLGPLTSVGASTSQVDSKNGEFSVRIVTD